MVGQCGQNFCDATSDGGTSPITLVCAVADSKLAKKGATAHTPTPPTPSSSSQFSSVFDHPSMPVRQKKWG